MFNFPPGYVIFLCQSTNLTLINLIYYGPSPGLAACIQPQVSKKKKLITHWKSTRVIKEKAPRRA